MKNMDFAALLCSRLCHDLVSPVGAINNGLEILQEEHDASMREAVIDLIEKSTRQTSNKLQFFRLAFGAAGGFSAQLDMREAERALRAFLDGSRVALEWQVDVPNAPKGLVKLLLNLALVVSESLIRGGALTVSMKMMDGKAAINIEGSGDRVILSPAVQAVMTGAPTDEELEPRTAPAYLAASVARDHGGRVSIEAVTETSVRVTASLEMAEMQTGG
ncbi:histidine phosphotransferase family protein [Kordiimonas marina]|uniref:histidine phosphotransferase family protein n=1 Tax=Kordiimonas marina TaxID=2872312 RepID=UPI001FF534AF|nr:histidine phosphotransferase family protein [Kordiimonas marina]MCJ9429573.1 histidine phosphotransferase [Kordiimonas marina]